MTGVVGRLAPSPTGDLHLGNAWTFLLAWLACRKERGRMILRMEDIDPVRSSDRVADGIAADLRWLGLDWDEGPYFQSRRIGAYERALLRIGATGRTYPCFCTRKELRDLAGAPHVEDRGAPYPGTCRHLTEEERAARVGQGRRASLRFNTEALHPFAFVDRIQGPQSMTLDACGGDFPLRRSDGVWSYQFAVSVDDAEMGVTQVVRGADLLVSTPRQLALFEVLGHRPPEYAHVPLLRDGQGERLAKRHGSLGLRTLRDAGRTAEEVIGFLAGHARLQEGPRPVSCASLVDGFSFDRLPRRDIVLHDMELLDLGTA